MRAPVGGTFTVVGPAVAGGDCAAAGAAASPSRTTAAAAARTATAGARIVVVWKGIRVLPKQTSFSCCEHLQHRRPNPPPANGRSWPMVPSQMMAREPTVRTAR
ncbi:hypothetical protein VHAB30_13620 [Variovorax boronicumulans]|nr:hypothetical protein VHAB30_13620 [Variovorax boronicumulans]